MEVITSKKRNDTCRSFYKGSVVITISLLWVITYRERSQRTSAIFCVGSILITIFYRLEPEE